MSKHRFDHTSSCGPRDRSSACARSGGRSSRRCDAQDNRVLGRGHVEADDIGGLGGELRILTLAPDEKPSIQALERAQGYLKLPNGRALTGHSHDYKRNGTTTLFAAYEVATGKVVAKHEKRRRRKEFLAFMDDLVAAYPNRRLEVVLDNLNTHKKNEEWLARHPLITFHRRAPPGSIRSRDGSRSCRASR